jgi:ribosomal protein L4
MKRTICLVICALFVVVMMSGVAFSAEKNVAKQGQEMMITGSINNANQIVAKDGQIFDVADTQEGKELLSHVGMKVQVKGTVLENEGKKQISVSAYEIIKE